MTELEQIKTMFARAGVVFEEFDNGHNVELTCEAGAGPANKGYSGFGASLVFSHAGELLNVGAWG